MDRFMSLLCLACLLSLASASGASSSEAKFRVWHDENGLRQSQVSRDGGATWLPARSGEPTLRLRDGRVVPGAPMPVPRTGWEAGETGRVFLVQFAAQSVPEFRDAVEGAGAEIVGYFPDQAHVVLADPRRVPAIRALGFVERAEPFHPWYRIDSEVRGWISAEGPATIRVNVMAFRWGADGKARIAAFARSIGASVDASWPSGHRMELTVTREQIRLLAAHDEVAWIDRWSPFETDMDLVREDSGANYVEDVHGFCGQGVRGEVLDAGVEATHMDFDGILLHGGNSSASHGTSTYGIVFGNGARDGDGDAKAEGQVLCEGSQGISADYDFLSDRFAHTQELKQSPYFASFQTNSWGNAQTTAYTSISSELDDIIFRLDIAVTQSQSNTGNRNSRPQAWGKNVISVGGIYHYETLSDADDCWCGGASIGPAEDGRLKPDVAYWYDSIYTTTTGNGYTSGFGGTSAATPETAGVVGLIVQMWAENVWETDPEGSTVFERQPHASTIKALLVNSARQYPFSGTAADLSRYKQGWGRPSAASAKDRAARSFVIDEEVNLLVGEFVSYDVDVDDGETELKVTMVYPDPAGTTSATLHRINDVNLRVISPSGLVYHGNVGLAEGTASAAGGVPNGVDTVENVFVPNPEPGLWKVEVEAAEVNQDGDLDTPEDDVTFALVVTGGTGSICDPPTVDFTAAPDPTRVGVPVTFDSTVSGGAGEPYTYRWDFDNDGTQDSDEANPVYVFPRPFQGLAKLRVRDAAGCPARAERAVTITGPDLRFEDYFDLTQVEGNGNGAVDPGEVFDLRLRLRNDGNEPAIGATVFLDPSPGNPGPISVLQGTSAFPDVAVGGTAESVSFYRIQVGQDFPCGQDLLLTVVSETTDPANVYPAEPAAVRILVGGAGPRLVFHADGFETNSGWTAAGGGEWQIAAPLGLGGQQVVPGQIPKPDPSSAYEGAQVLGNDLTGTGRYPGNYEDDVSSTMTSASIDCSGAVDVELRFARWLNTEAADVAKLELSGDGGQTWTTLFSDDTGSTEQAWTQVSYDVAAIADRQASVRIRFGLQSDAALVQGGWNVDALEMEGITRESCEPVSRGMPGVAAALRVDRGAPGELSLSWQGDCGAGESYAIYRGDLLAGYGSIAAEPGSCTVAGLAATVPEGPGTADFFLVVPNDGAFEGSYGAATAGPRPPAGSPCLPTDRIDACAPQ